MKLNTSTCFFNDAWIAKHWMDNGRGPWIDAKVISILAVEAYADLDGFLPGGVHLDWLSS